MIEQLVIFITQHLKGVASNELICFIISLFPILELRGGMIAASPLFLNVEYKRALIFCILGNLLPIPFILLLLEHILNLMRKISPFNKVASWLDEKANKHKDQIETAGFWGLVLFVGIPLPGTGAWTGSLIATALGMKFKKAFLAITLGVLLAAAIMSTISYGILGSAAKIIN
jgi:uncharacterized membrane protein